MVSWCYNSPRNKYINLLPPYRAQFWWEEILTDTDSSNIWRKIFRRIATVFHYTPVHAKQFDGLNIDGVAGKHQKCQNFPRQNLRYTATVLNNIILRPWSHLSIAQASSFFKHLNMRTFTYGTPTIITKVLHLVTRVQLLLITVTVN